MFNYNENNEGDLMNRKIILFIAMSLDGYIAGIDGNVDWLAGEDKNNQDNQCYLEFIKDIDTVIMGWKTYAQVVNELSVDEWPYEGMKTYVVTHQDKTSSEDIIFTSMNPGQLISKLKKESGKDIWICGGANIIHQLLEDNCIDRFHISVIPTLLGNGIRLFNKLDKELQLQLIKTQSYNGITDLVYEKR